MYKRQDHNCCECEKCFRTVLGLVAEAAEVRDYGFHIQKTLKEHWADVMFRRSGLMLSLIHISTNCGFFIYCI